MVTLLFLQFLALFFLSFCLWLYFFFSSTNKPTKPGFKIYPILGSLPEFLKNRHRFLDWTTEVLSKCPNNTAIFRRPGRAQGIITANPSNLEHILKTNFENYPKGERFISLLVDFLGNGIFNSDGELWKVQRKTAIHEFNTKSLRNFVMNNVKIEISSRLIPVLEKASKTNQVLDLQEILERFAFDNICKLAFNVDTFCLSDDGIACNEFMHAFDKATMLSTGRFMYAFPILWKIKKLFHLGSEKTLKKSIEIVHDFANEIIKSRITKEKFKKDEDLLSRFIGDGDNYSLEFLRDIVISFILAGRDTTSSGLSWFFWLLSLNPHVEKKIRNELEEIRSKNGKKIGETYSFDEIREMHYLHAAISETLRLYPPVHVDTKACAKDDYLPDGTFIGQGWFITYHTYAMGRMENIWGKNCLEFIPERWLDNGIYQQENPFKFPVFHAGPRMCLGKNMAYIQMKSIAASIIERFHIDVINKENCPEYLLSMTLRMKNGLQVNVKERSDSICA